MKTYRVFDCYFNEVGTVQAENPEAALALAKARYKYVPGVMVEEWAPKIYN